jgi:acetyl esterase/lipase
LIVWIHGGGWHGGDKEGGADLARRFLPAGFAVASIDYRLTKDHAPFPAQIEDCFAALIWLRQHADKYHIDPEHVGVVGHSAGAHLSALIATTGNTSKFFTNAPVSTSVQAAVMWAGPFDLGRERAHWPRTTFIWNPADPFCQTFFPGGAYDETFARWASPATYLHSNLPPMLIVHGGRDTLVPESQAAAFAQSAKAMGNDVTYRVDPLHGHDVMQPDAITEALAFFEKTLKRGATTNGAP